MIHINVDDYLELTLIILQKLALIGPSSLCWGRNETVVTCRESLFRKKNNVYVCWGKMSIPDYLRHEEE